MLHVRVSLRLSTSLKNGAPTTRSMVSGSSVYDLSEMVAPRAFFSGFHCTAMRSDSTISDGLFPTPNLDTRCNSSSILVLYRDVVYLDSISGGSGSMLTLSVPPSNGILGAPGRAGTASGLRLCFRYSVWNDKPCEILTANTTLSMFYDDLTSLRSDNLPSRESAFARP